MTALHSMPDDCLRTWRLVFHNCKVYFAQKWFEYKNYRLMRLQTAMRSLKRTYLQMHVVTFLLPNLRRLYLVHRNLDLDSEREQKKFRKAKILHNFFVFLQIFKKYWENLHHETSRKSQSWMIWLILWPLVPLLDL